MQKAEVVAVCCYSVLALSLRKICSKTECAEGLVNFIYCFIKCRCQFPQYCAGCIFNNLNSFVSFMV